MTDSTDILTALCQELSIGAKERAAALAREGYPMPRVSRYKRTYTALDVARTAMRDGFIDRYTGKRLVFPGALRLLSVLLPEELPYDSSWAYDKGHPMFWDLYATLDHVVPIARGGVDAPDNWVLASQRTNSAKAHFTLEELGWQLVPPGNLAAWDGLLGWFIDYTDARPELAKAHKHVHTWRSVARRARMANQAATAG
jgi:hypothetical protein